MSFVQEKKTVNGIQLAAIVTISSEVIIDDSPHVLPMYPLTMIVKRC